MAISDLQLLQVIKPLYLPSSQNSANLLIYETCCQFWLVSVIIAYKYLFNKAQTTILQNYEHVDNNYTFVEHNHLKYKELHLEYTENRQGW